MSRSSTARHARPKGRGAIEAAYAGLRTEISSLRSDRYTDHLELTRLAALVEGLAVTVAQLSRELAEVRLALHEARSAPAQRDPAIEVLAAQAADLRAASAAQYEHMATLTARIGDLTAEVARRPVAPLEVSAPTPAVASYPAVPAEAAPVEVAAPASVPVEVAAPPPVPVEVAPPIPAADWAPAPAPQPVAAPEAASPPRPVASLLAGLASRPPVPVRAPASPTSPYPATGPGSTTDAAALDDEALLRLRTMPEAYGA
jgi:hypothetical protein